MKFDKEFDLKFPSSARKFTMELSALTTRARASVDDNTWFLMLSSDLLLTRATSHREPTDLFTIASFWRTLNVYRSERAMATKKPQTKERSQNDRAEWQGFLDLRLSEDQLAALDESKPKPSELWAAIDDIISSDYRFILSYNKRTKLASVTLVDDNPDRKTGGYALSSADSDGAGALKMAVYKHVVLLERDWSSLLDQPAKVRRG